MKTIDTKGLTCPRPLIMLKEALLETGVGEAITVITDNETSLKNLVTYLNDQGIEPEVSSEGKVHTIETVVPEQLLGDTEPALYCNWERC